MRTIQDALWVYSTETPAQPERRKVPVGNCHLCSKVIWAGDEVVDTAGAESHVECFEENLDRVHRPAMKPSRFEPWPNQITWLDDESM